MNTKVALRKEAVRLYWQAGLSKAEISRQLKKSRRWVVRWLARYDPEQGEKSLEDHSSAPKHRKEVYPARIKNMALKSRKARKGIKKTPPDLHKYLTHNVRLRSGR